MELMSEEEIEDEISISSDEELLTIDADCQTEASHCHRESQTHFWSSHESEADVTIKEFFLAMGFRFDSNFAVDNIRKYYAKFPVAKQFTENRFNRTNPQSHHSTAVKDFTTALALKHSVSSAAE